MAVKVLIVEDDQLIQRMYQKMFTFEKFDVELASDGLEGLEKARKDKPTVILLDIMMPKLNGVEVLEKLKADPDTAKIPVIMLSNLAGEKDIETALSKGAVKYIIKSEFLPNKIVDMVKEVIKATTRDQIPG